MKIVCLALMILGGLLALASNNIPTLCVSFAVVGMGYLAMMAFEQHDKDNK